MKTFKTRCYLTKSALEYCERAFGVRRKMWNYCLDRFNDIKRATGKLPSNRDIVVEYREFIKTVPDRNFQWIAEQQVSARLVQEVCKDVTAAFALVKTQSFKMHRWGLKPHFKTKRDTKQTFSYQHATERTFRVDSEYVFSFEAGRQGRQTLRTRESMNFLRHDNVKLCKMTIFKDSGVYWLVVSYKKLNYKKLDEDNNPTEVVRSLPGSKTSKIGIDLGTVISAAAYDGTLYVPTQFATSNSLRWQRKAKRANAKLHKMQHGSHNYEKWQNIVQKRFGKAKRIRNEQLELYTTNLCRQYHEIVIDDFSFKSTLKINKKNRTAKERAYVSMCYQFKLRLEQKAVEYGTIVRYVEHLKGQRTTHKCCRCNSTNVFIDEKTRILTCNNCGFVIDRDKNAAINTFRL